MSRGSIINHLVLAHHRQGELDRCVMVPWGRRKLAVCARCLALYPTLFAAIAVQIAVGVAVIRWDGLLVTVGVLPMLVDWAVARLRWARGTHALRLGTGALGGLALGRAFYIYFRDPWSEVFWVTIVGLVIVALAVEIVRALRLHELP